ncbi:MAG: hypothetical protein C0468_04695 [Planctomyces sp.]|nr:hypothetical protein [Planctomyces sp.]
MCAIAVPAAASTANPNTYAVSSLRIEAQSWTYVPLLARTQLPDGSSATAAHSVLAIPDPATRTGDNFIAVWYTPDPAQPTGWSAVAWNTRTTLDKVYAQIADQLDIPDDPALDEWPYVPELSAQEIFPEDLPFPLANGVDADDPLAPALGVLPPETQGEILEVMADNGYGADDGPLQTSDTIDPPNQDPNDNDAVYSRGLTAIAQATPFIDDFESFTDVFMAGVGINNGATNAAEAIANDGNTTDDEAAINFNNCQDVSYLLQFGPEGPIDDANSDGYPDWLVLGLKPTFISDDGALPSIYDLLLADGYGFDSNGVLRFCAQPKASPECKYEIRIQTPVPGSGVARNPVQMPVPIATRWFLVDHDTAARACTYERYSDKDTYQLVEVRCIATDQSNPNCPPKQKYTVIQYFGTIEKKVCTLSAGALNFCPSAVPINATVFSNAGCSQADFEKPFTPNIIIPGFIPLQHRSCYYPILP